MWPLFEMCSMNAVILVLTAHFTVQSAGQMSTKESKFRILAPQFICPKDEEAVVEKLDNTVITLQTAADADLRIEWVVRWTPLPAPTQRFTIMLWRTVRALEKQLNKSPPEPYVYVIENSDLLPGVNYIFNISSIESNGEISEPKSFNIDNTQGDQKLMIEGRNDMLSVVLVGAQVALVDVAYVVEAQITTCQPTQDYYFSWIVQNLETHDMVNVSKTQGNRLEVPPYILRVDLAYSVTCQVMRLNNADLITLTSLPFRVHHRGLEVYLNTDYLSITMEQPFTMESTVISHDYYDDPVLVYEWECKHERVDCSAISVIDDGTIIFPTGLSELGEYHITLTVSIADQTSTANATLTAVEPILPVIQISPLSRKLNEGEVVSVVANASNVAPTCAMAWYFATGKYLDSLNEVTANETCDDCEHGELLTETVTIYSLEEQFLNEIADYTNETEWRQITAAFPATAGRARFVAQCGCSLTFNCETQGAVYAEIWFHLNERPKPEVVSISPESGTALETEFRISTRAVRDQDSPLRYSFYCRVGNHSILLASYIEHRAVETLLPYSKDGTEVWVQVCDALGACAQGHPKVLTLSPGELRTLDTLTQDVQAHARRCEMMLLNKVAQSTVITYKNAGQSESLTKFSRSLQNSLSSMDKDCAIKYYDQYSKLLYWLAKEGIETENLIYNS